jgi:uncharacterized membrane protein
MTTKAERYVFVDLMRFLAIFLMFADHSIKLFYNFQPDNSFSYLFYEIAKYTLLITTFSAPLFLFLVGTSVVLSFNNKPRNINWLKRKTKRGVFLILASFALYFYQSGISEIPYTSGILQLIGVSLIIASVLMFISRKFRLLLFALLTLITLTTHSTLSATDVRIQILTMSNFPFLPYIAYVFAGGFIAESYFRYKNKKNFQKILAAVSTLVSLFFIFLSGFNPFLIAASYSVVNNYMIQSSLTVIFYISLLTLLFLGLSRIENYLRNNYLIKQAGLIGREALNIYILHILVGWGVSRYLLDEAKFGFWAAVLSLISFTLMGWLWVKLKRNGYLNIFSR